MIWTWTIYEGEPKVEVSKHHFGKNAFANSHMTGNVMFVHFISLKELKILVHLLVNLKHNIPCSFLGGVTHIEVFSDFCCQSSSVDERCIAKCDA